MTQPADSQRIMSTLEELGYVNATKISNSLQGTVWRASYKGDANKSVIIKVARRDLHKSRAAIVNGKRYEVQENIKMEATMLHKLAKLSKCPKSIVAFKRFESLNENYFLVEEDGGSGALFDFVVKAHAFIKNGSLEVAEWQRVSHHLFKQMTEAVAFIHSHNICHFDISLENFVISDVQIELSPEKKIRFLKESMQVKLCDFGLAEQFDARAAGEQKFLSKKYVGKKNYQSPELLQRRGAFDAKKNDIWCLAVCLFCMTFGSAPFIKADESEESFVSIMEGGLEELAKGWKLSHMCNEELMDILQSLFQYEPERMSLSKLTSHSWFNQSCSSTTTV